MPTQGHFYCCCCWRRLAIFFWIMLVFYVDYYDVDHVLAYLAIFFWIMHNFLGRPDIASRIPAACYFLLNYAEALRRCRRRLRATRHLAIFFWIMRALTRAGARILRGVELAIFFWIMPGSFKGAIDTGLDDASCYFLLNYARTCCSGRTAIRVREDLLFSFELCSPLRPW